MRSATLFLALLTLTSTVPAPLLASGSNEEEVMSPEDQAEEAYHRAVGYREEARRLEEEAEGLDGDAATGKLAKARKEYEKAARSLRAAIGFDEGLYQAHSDLGFALRKLGDYEEALESYGRALELEPGYPEAVEYRAEAYLALGRLDEAKEAYMGLLRDDRAHADELMEAMKRWVEERRADPGDLDAAAVEGFAQWVEEREQAASQTADLGSGASPAGW